MYNYIYSEGQRPSGGSSILIHSLCPQREIKLVTNLQTNTTNKNQTKTPSEEKKGDGGLKKATIEMIRKDWKKQQQKERQARSQSSPPTKETKSKSSQGTQRPSTSNRERKGSNNVIQQHNRFGSLSDSSDDMELGEAPDRPRTNRNRSRSSEHSHVNNSNNRSKSPITYP